MSRILQSAQSNELVVSNQAALALLKMAKATSDPKAAAGLIEAAAGLKDQAGELPPQYGK